MIYRVSEEEWEIRRREPRDILLSFRAYKSAVVKFFGAHTRIYELWDKPLCNEVRWRSLYEMIIRPDVAARIGQ